MKYFSMFSGIGGFELGIQKAYETLNISRYQFPQSKTKRKGVEDRQHQLHSGQENYASCIGYSEIDKYAIQIYEKHFKHKNYGNATLIDEKQLPDFELLVGGFPCQAFSIAGKRRGFDEARGTLFFDIARILKHKKPRNFILENVKGLLSHDGGNTFTTIIRILSDMGYFVEWQVLNAKNFGVPQNRERVFIVGHFGGIPRRKVFPITGSNGETKSLVYAQKSDREIARIYDPKGLAPTLHLKTGGWQEPKIEVKRQPLKFLDRNQKNIEGDYAFTVDSLNTGGIKQGMKIRRLTPKECERLMGYPDDWTLGLSDTQRYKTLGNGIVSNVVAEVIKGLL